MTTWDFLLSLTSLLGAVHSLPDLLGTPSALIPWGLSITLYPQTWQHFVRMAHSLVHFQEPQYNQRESHSFLPHPLWLYKFSCYYLPNLSALAQCSNQHSAFRTLVGSRHMAPKSRVKEEDQTYHFFFLINSLTSTSSAQMADPVQAGRFSCLASIEPGYEMFKQLLPPLPIPLQVNAVEGMEGEGEKHLSFSSTWKGSEKAFSL